MGQTSSMNKPINWEEMKDLQLSFFKAGVSHIDVPQDHAFISTLYHFANKYNVKYILNGGNLSTEKTRKLIDQLHILEQEHRDLDEVIFEIQEKKTINLLQIQRLKKRKLLLKDKIENLKDKIEPDIIA